MKMFTFVLIAVMLSGIAVAAEVPTSEGDKALVFNFDGLAELDLDGPYTYGIGMRYYIADYTAIRGTVIFGNCSYTEEADMEGYADYEENYTMYGLEAVYEKHMESPCASVVPYWGLGAGFEMGNDEVVEPTGSDGGTSSANDKWTAFYVFGALGFEWAFTDCMTLGGEYNAGFYTASGETEYDYSGGERTETCCKWTDTCIMFSETSVFLSVYW